MTALSDQALDAYDQHIPGAPEARLRDPHTAYAHELLRHLLAVADLAMLSEQIPPDTRRRILMTITIGQPTPADAEERIRVTTDMAKRLAEAGLPPMRPKG